MKVEERVERSENIRYLPSAPQSSSLAPFLHLCLPFPFPFPSPSNSTSPSPSPSPSASPFPFPFPLDLVPSLSLVVHWLYSVPCQDSNSSFLSSWRETNRRPSRS